MTVSPDRSRPQRPAASRRRRRPRTGQRTLAVAPDSLVVLAGLPGAGKTTLLRALDAGRPAGVLALDAEEVAALARARAGRVPYRLLRPLVHGLHLLRVVRAVHGPAACVLTTDPMTSTLRRAWLRIAAVSSGRRLDVVLVDATAEQARTGQAVRGRTLGRRRMARHVARAAHLRRRMDEGHGMSLVDGVLVLPRPAARPVDGVVVRSTGLSLQPPRHRAA